MRNMICCYLTINCYYICTKKEMLNGTAPLHEKRRRSVAQDCGKQQVSNVRNSQALRVNPNVLQLHETGYPPLFEPLGTLTTYSDPIEI